MSSRRASASVEGAFFQGQIEMQPSGAAVQEHSARLRQAALTPPALDAAGVDKVLSVGADAGSAAQPRAGAG